MEGVLADGALHAPDDRYRGVIQNPAFAVDALAVRLHLELLQVCGQQAQRIRIRQHRVRRSAEEIAVPHPDRRHQHRDVLLERRLREVAIDIVRAGQEFLKPVETHGTRRGEADCRPHGEAPADPVPHRQDFACAELLRRLDIRGHGVKDLPSPFFCRCRVRHRFRRGEGLRDDDEERGPRVSAFEGAFQVARVGVGGEPYFERAVAQRVGEQARAEIRAAGSQVDDPLELSFSSQFCCHRAHACQCLAHFGRGRGPSSKSGVPGSALLRRIDGFAGEQRLAPLREAALVGQVGEQPQRHCVHALAREVVTHPWSLGGKLARGKQIAQADRAPRLGMRQELRPGRAFGRGSGIHLTRR